MDRNSVNCWFDEFHDYLKRKNKRFPIEYKDEFYKELKEWMIKTPEGKLNIMNNNLGLIDDKLVYI